MKPHLPYVCKADTHPAYRLPLLLEQIIDRHTGYHLRHPTAAEVYQSDRQIIHYTRLEIENLLQLAFMLSAASTEA